MVFVLNKESKPLMPTERGGRVRWLLKTKQAKVISRKPFTIQLLYKVDDITQDYTLKIKPGRDCIRAYADNIEFILQTRNKDVPKLMRERKARRQAHRRYKRRMKRQRRAVKNNTVKAALFERFLPGYEKPVNCKFITNKEAKFSNRVRKEGWLTPTANHLLQTHVNFINKIAKFIPVKEIDLPIYKFFWKENTDTLKGYKSVKDKVNHVQKGKCYFCDNPIEENHHIMPASKGGSNTFKNRIGVCGNHHGLMHTDFIGFFKGFSKEHPKAGVLNQIFPQLVTILSKKYSLNIVEQVEIENVSKIFKLQQFRRHDRKAVHQENVNRRYYLNGELVATNRHRAIEQDVISLEEYMANGGVTDKLTVKPHPKTYQRQDKIMPGALMKIGNQVKVFKGSQGLHTLKNGSKVVDYYTFTDGTKATPKNCKLLVHNTGLVFVA